MPIYVRECGICGTKAEVWRLISQYDEPYPCPECGEDTKLLLSCFNVYGGFKAGKAFANQELALGRKFSSVREIDDYCKRTGTEHCGEYKPKEVHKEQKITMDEIVREGF